MKDKKIDNEDLFFDKVAESLEKTLRASTYSRSECQYPDAEGLEATEENLATGVFDTMFREKLQSS